VDTLIFIVSQLVKPFFRIESILALLIVLIAIFHFRRWKNALNRTIIASVVVISLTIYTAPAQYLVRGLENKHSEPTKSEYSEAGGLIVLGGALIEGATPFERNQSLINENGERLTTSLELLRENPKLKIIYSTYSGQLIPNGLTENQAAEEFYKDQGVAANRLLLDNKSRNTYENAKASLEVIKPGNTPWILLTSATHMNRSVKTFEEAGWRVIPYPVDYQTGLSIDWSQLSTSRGIQLWNRYIHETVASILYLLRFQID
jgi:uncharacterized SAM-binding protein YcdF (DUF218 family)